MSRTKSEISLTARQILQFIRFRIKVSKTGTFFGDNSYVAEHLGIQITTAKQLINKLIRLEYLSKAIDKNGRRHLTYTGKPYVEVIEDMRNCDKRVLKQECDGYKRDAAYYQNELQGSELRIKKLERDISDLTMKLHKEEMRVSYLEQFLCEQGYTKEQLEQISEKQYQKLISKPDVIVPSIKHEEPKATFTQPTAIEYSKPTAHQEKQLEMFPNRINLSEQSPHDVIQGIMKQLGIESRYGNA